MRRNEALVKIRPTPIEMQGARGFQVVGANFVLESTCEVGFVKDVALCLEEVFAAYRKYFDLRRNVDQKIKIYVLADQEEYVRFQTRRHGGAILNPAYYHTEENYIAAYNMIQREEERKVRAEIVRVENEIEKFKSDVTTAERKVDGLAKDFRKKITDAAWDARKAIRNDGAGNKEARLQEIDRQEKELLDNLKKQETEAQKELQDARKKANEAIAENRKIIERNEKVLANQNRLMFETLFHEGFHAFAANFLWQGSGQKEFPRWLHEGMATYFEVSVVEGGELIHGAPHPDLFRLYKEKAILNTLIPVDQVVTGGADKFLVVHRSQADRSTAYYMQSWALAHFVASTLKREQIATYVGDVLSGQDGVKAFEKMMGKPCRGVEADLKKHMDSLKAP